MKRYTFISILVLFSFSLYCNDAIEVTVGAGYTVIDLDTLVENDENDGTILTDWNQFTYGISLQYFFYQIGVINLGAEMLYQHMYWYSVKIPYGAQPIYRDYAVTNLSIAPVVRFHTSTNSAVDLGPIFIFNDSLDIGFFTSFNYYVHFFDNFEIPIKLRVEVRDGTEIYFPITLGAGVMFQL